MAPPPSSEWLAEALSNALPQVQSVFRRFHVPVADRDDVLHDALLALLRNSESVEDPPAWLVGTLKFKCLRYWRSRRRCLYDAVDRGLLESLDTPARECPERDAANSELHAALAKIDRRCRNVLELRYFAGCKAKELAERTGYRASSVGKITSRCIGALSRQLGRKNTVTSSCLDE